jgi:hypothetical protein
MKNYNEGKLYDEQIYSLQEELEELLVKAEKILDYKSEDINEVVEKLLILNTEESDELAADIISIEEDMIITEEYYSEIDSENPFNNLYDQDSDLSF